MKAPNEIRRWVNRVKSRQAGKNGVVKFLWDTPEMERKLSASKKNYRRGYTDLPICAL